ESCRGVYAGGPGAFGTANRPGFGKAKRGNRAHTRLAVHNLENSLPFTLATDLSDRYGRRGWHGFRKRSDRDGHFDQSRCPVRTMNEMGTYVTSGVYRLGWPYAVAAHRRIAAGAVAAEPG